MINVADFCLGFTLAATSCCLVAIVVSSTITKVTHTIRQYKIDKLTAEVQEQAQRAYLDRIKELTMQEFIELFGGTK